jgi:hypothetical protein
MNCTLKLSELMDYVKDTEERVRKNESNSKSQALNMIMKRKKYKFFGRNLNLEEATHIYTTENVGFFTREIMVNTAYSSEKSLCRKLKDMCEKMGGDKEVTLNSKELKMLNIS